MQPAASVARTSTDLGLTVAVTLAAAVFALSDLPVAVRLPLGMAVVLVLPGYALAAILFPGRELDRVERAALSVGLSLGLIVLSAPVVALLPGGLGARSITLALTLLTVGLALVALARRARLPAGEGGGRPAVGWLGLARRPEAILPFAIVLIAGVALVGIGTDFASRPATEFFLVEPMPASGGADGRPLQVRTGAPIKLRLGITAPGQGAHIYRITADGDDRRLAALGPIELGADDSWVGTVEIALSSPGRQAVSVTLLIDDQAAAFRELRLEFLVGAAPPSPSAEPPPG